jgi:tRNA A-37 threonylcarbamoyl transferase component Bud32
MGVVYKARQMSLNRRVALKMILAGEWATPEARQRFRAEAEAAANLQHPNIVAIHEVGEHEGQQYFSMDFVPGKNLAELGRGSPLSAERAASYVQTIAEAIHFAHERGILHRDLKPQNVLIDADDRPRITDFGLAKRVDTDSGLTRTGDVIGSPSYMPPEQADSRPDEVGPESDVYSLGAILYELLTGHPPFRAATALETLCQVIQSPPVSLRKLNPAVPRDLETICLKCLQKSPAKRFGSAHELAEELGRYLHGQRILSNSRRLEPARTWRWVGWGALIGAVVGVVLGAIGWPPQSFLSTSITNPEVHVIWRALGGCLFGVLGAAAAVLLWNTIVLPAWLLRQTTVPLAKVALGLGLLFNGLVLTAVQVYVYDVQLLPGMALKDPLLLETVATLLAVLGPILCLEIAPQSRSSGVLLSAVVLQISTLVIGANPVVNELKVSSNSRFTWAGLLAVASLPLFLVFLQRLARTLQRPDLEKRARSILKVLAWCLGALMPFVAANLVYSFVPGLVRYVQWVWPLLYFICLLGILVVLPLFFLRSFLLIRALQGKSRSVFESAATTPNPLPPSVAKRHPSYATVMPVNQRSAVGISDGGIGRVVSVEAVGGRRPVGGPSVRVRRIGRGPISGFLVRPGSVRRVRRKWVGVHVRIAIVGVRHRVVRGARRETVVTRIGLTLCVRCRRSQTAGTHRDRDNDE